MEATEPMSVEQAAESLLIPEEPQSEKVETEAEEATVEDEQTEAEEVEAEEDDAEVAGDESDQEDEDDDHEETAEEEEPADTYTVKVDGQEKQVTLEELTRGYSGQAYIQKGMQDVSAKQKEAEQIFNSLQTEREQLSQFIQQVQQAGIKAPPTPPDATTFDSDPIGYMEKKVAYDTAKAEYDQQQAQLQQMTAQQRQAEEQARQVYMAKQAELLTTYIPELADADKAGAVRGKIVDAGREYGLSDQELGGIIDARHINILNDARKWREFQAGKKTLTEKAVKKSRPVVKAASKRKADPTKAVRDKQRARLRQTGSLEDAAALLLE